MMEEIGKGLSLDAPIRPVFHTIKQPWNQKAAVITWPLGSSGKEGGSFMHADSVPVPGCELRDLVVDCIEVLKVYDQCVKEDVLPQQIALPGTCPNPLPPGATVDCALVFGIEAATGLPETRCEVINVGPPDVEGFADVTVRQRLVFDITIFDAFGNVLCGPTRIGPEFFFNTVLLFAPEGTFGQCRILSTLCHCEIIPDPDNPGLNVLLCTKKICKEIQIKALVKLCVPTYGFCVPAPCVTRPQPEFPCPPENIFPPQRPRPSTNT
jgi:hypothetical protein